MTASTTDYYGILGLTSDATLTDVKKACRELARQHHPDRNRPGSPAADRRRQARRVLRVRQPRVDHAGRDLAGHSRT